MYKCLQTNLKRARAALDLAYKTIEERRVDIAIVSEPNRHMISRGAWLIDENCNVAIKNFNKKLRILKNGNGKGYVWIEMRDIVVYGCYISPNVPLEHFTEFLGHLRDSMLQQTKGIVVGGDFNAKSHLWGSPQEDQRGNILSEWLGERNLVLQNLQDKPTFIRGDTKSWIDVTFTTANAAARITGWKVSDEENLSDHQNIYFDIIDKRVNTPGNHAQRRGWRINDVGLAEIVRHFRGNIALIPQRQQKHMTAENFVNLVSQTCDQALLKRTEGMNNRKPVYWWTEDIASLRRRCLSFRRDMVRANRTEELPREERTRLREAYANQRKLLRNAIKQAKIKAWKDVIEEVENDLWGNGYRIVTNKFQLRKNCTLTDDEKFEEAEKLFPSDPLVCWEPLEVNQQDIPLFTLEELQIAEERIKLKKAPGPDNVPSEVIKTIVKNFPHICQNLMNNLLIEGNFPKIWKEASLVLIEKEKKYGEVEIKYRPLCLINVLGKFLEQLLTKRMWEEIHRSGGLSKFQFGFCPGKSTIDAIMAVQESVNKVSMVPWNQKGFCVLVTLDVQNAFNMTPWRGVIEEIKKREIPTYLVKMICSYLSERTLTIGEKKMDIRRGVPQGSVLGPLLWNIYYDEVLRLPMPEGVQIIGYADDLAVVATADSERILKIIVEHAIETVSEWMATKRLHLAPQKTEAVLLAGRRKLSQMTIMVESTSITTVKALKYLGVMMDKDMRMVEHIKANTEKSERAAMALSRLMPNIGGPKASKRRTMSTVVYSIMLYAAPVWQRALRFAKYREMAERVQRRISLRVCSAYRTVSTEAAILLADTPPFDLLVQERVELHRRGKDERKNIRTEIINQWQQRWENLQNKAVWTKVLISDIRLWMNRKHGEINYYLTQMVTGHGCFQEYLNRFRIAENGECWYCGLIDTAYHTFFECDRWAHVRTQAENSVGEQITPENIIEIMMQNENKWNVISEMAVNILKIKEEDERRRQL